MSKAVFRFKQFGIRQDNCAMKVGTDGFLLGVFAAVGKPARILDIGTGTGLVALMLAQQTTATIDALEIDAQAAAQAKDNFAQSPWANRLQVYETAFEEFTAIIQYDLIVSNPPYFVQAYSSPNKQRNTARHAEIDFLGDWLQRMAGMLSAEGKVFLILPYTATEKVVLQATAAKLQVCSTVTVRSFTGQESKRVILGFSKTEEAHTTTDFVIYDAVNVYSAAYAKIAAPFFLHF